MNRSRSIRPPVPRRPVGRAFAAKRFVFRKVVQALGLALLAFVLLRIVGPWLVDLHNTAALVLAVALLALGALLVGWYAWDLLTSLNRRRNGLA